MPAPTGFYSEGRALATTVALAGGTVSDAVAFPLWASRADLAVVQLEVVWGADGVAADEVTMAAYAVVNGEADTVKWASTETTPLAGGNAATRRISMVLSGIPAANIVVANAGSHGVMFSVTADLRLDRAPVRGD
ncbi:MAG: hypothetical protein GF320_06165 [Armatimonadia bacterium]|nr:hypothetical protein [Armatimonadia bacterium]